MKISLIPIETIERRIFIIRGQKIMLDSHLAELYQVETFNLNKAVKRNSERFPVNFMFQLTDEEVESLTFQIGISKPTGRGGRRTLPYVFTEQGVAMLSTVLNSKRAITVNIAIMRTFVRLRQVLATHQELAKKVRNLEKQTASHRISIKKISTILKELFEPPLEPEEKKNPIGFRMDK